MGSRMSNLTKDRQYYQDDRIGLASKVAFVIWFAGPTPRWAVSTDLAEHSSPGTPMTLSERKASGNHPCTHISVSLISNFIMSITWIGSSSLSVR